MARKQSFLAKPLKTQAQSPKRSAHSHVQRFFVAPGYGGWLLGHIVLLCGMFRPERNAAVARRIDCEKKFGGDDDKMRPSGLRLNRFPVLTKVARNLSTVLASNAGL
jgi:hypothetical protein